MGIKFTNTTVGRRGVVGKHELSPLGYFSLILFAFVQWSMLGRLKLSVSDVIVSQKGSNGDRTLHTLQERL